MRLLRGLVGPIVIGLSVWCAAGTIAVAAPDAATARFAVPAPLWIWAAAAALAALVPGLRRRPAAAVPALLATVAWWPVPLLPIGLLFTGPLAWLPIALALVLAVGAVPLTAVVRRLGADQPGRASWLAAAATLLLVGATAWAAAPQSPGGDEPHYLVITQSLLEDGDLRIENNHRQRDYAAYFGGTLDPHYLVLGKNQQIYSVHAPGLPTLVLPGFALFGYRGAEGTVMLLAALTGALIWRIGWRTTRDVRAAWFAWASIATATTFLIQGFTIYPDGPAMVAVAAATLLLLRLSETDVRPGPLALVVTSVPLAALPWLHTRFAVIAAGFGVLIAARLLTETGRSLAGRLGRLLTFVAVPAASAACWFAFFYIIYGTVNPTAPYGGSADTHLQYAPGGLVAVLFDGQFGLLTYAPVLVVAVVGWCRPVSRSAGRAGLETLAVAALYAAAAMTYWMWWAGRPAPPARFIAAMLPVLAIPMAAVWAKGDALRRTALVALIGVAMGLSGLAIGGARGVLAWNDRDAQSRLLSALGPLVNLRRAWPSFFWTLDPNFSWSNLSSEWIFVGRVVLFVGIWVGLWVVVRLVGRRLTDVAPFRLRALVAAWLAAGLVVVAQAGWLAAGVSGLDAEPAQASLLAQARHGAAVVGLEAFHVSRLPRFGGRMTLASQEPGKVVDPPPWFVGGNLPAGDYQVRLDLRVPEAVLAGLHVAWWPFGGSGLRPGALTVKTGSAYSGRGVDALTTQEWSLHVPDDETTVVMMSDEALAGAGGRIRLTASWGR